MTKEHKDIMDRVDRVCEELLSGHEYCSWVYDPETDVLTQELRSSDLIIMERITNVR